MIGTKGNFNTLINLQFPPLPPLNALYPLFPRGSRRERRISQSEISSFSSFIVCSMKTSLACCHQIHNMNRKLNFVLSKYLFNIEIEFKMTTGRAMGGFHRRMPLKSPLSTASNFICCLSIFFKLGEQTSYVKSEICN